jgi:8-oxo-dGTP diphosphatase
MSNTTLYVCGFLFDEDLQHVVLIWKEKPDWQKGKLNGVGGKIEPHEIDKLYLAMIREFKEETGLDIQQWSELISARGDDWRVYFYYAVSKDAVYVETREAEEVAFIPVDRLDDFAHIENLRWLIPLAIDKIKNFSGIIETI